MRWLHPSHGVRLAAVGLLLSGCLLDRSGLATQDANAAPDAATRIPDAAADAANPGDASMTPMDAGDADACTPTLELCNGVDDDCDPTTRDGAEDPQVGAACDSDDSDLCADDRYVCAEGTVACEDVAAERPEVACNGLDDDCDGETDEGDARCGGCDRVTRAGQSYLFCRDASVQGDWFEASAHCQTLGYELVVVEDEAENRWVSDTAADFDGVEAWWIGLSDHGTEGVYVWSATGTPAGYTRWNAGGNPQPNDDIRVADEDWVFLESNAEGTWFDNFLRDSRFVCEAAGPIT